MMGLMPFFLRRASERLLCLLSKFMVACYTHCFIPKNVLSGDMNPTVKDTKGNAASSSNYRPVMQSSCILKLFELHLEEVLSEKLHFSSRQFGYVAQTSTTDACLILKETVNKYISKGGKAFALFVDLSKAFDNVNHFMLGQLLIDRDVPPDLVMFLMHYLRNQEARIVWNGVKGKYHCIDKGVRQGGILSPLLFKLYVDNVLREITAMEVGCKLGILRVNILAYADDFVILADTKEHLDVLYEILERKLRLLHLIINKNKSKCIVFKKGIRSGENLEMDIGGDSFEVVSQIKYLGHVLQNNLHDADDIAFRLNSFYAKLHWILRNFKNTSLEVLLFLFNAYCSPNYGLPLWCLESVTKTQIFKTFEVAYSNAFKKMLGTPVCTSSHAVADACNVLLFSHYCVYIQMRFFKRILRSKNVLLRTLLFHIKEGYIYQALTKRFIEKYDCHFLEHTMDILKLRVYWVQRHEPSSGRELVRVF